jgi:hypothetical protein
MQQKKNVKLLILWIALVLITIVAGIYRPDQNKLDLDKDHFALKERVNSLTQITITNASTDITLSKTGRQWSLNDKFTADPSKINDLLGILSEVSVRREVAAELQSTLTSSDNYKVTLYDSDQVIQSFEVSQNKQGTLTYFIDELAYVVNIPGYSYHIADIFTLSTPDWRSPYVFASNWNTLDKMQIKFSPDSVHNFEIVYDNLGYTIPSIANLDTAAMYTYMEQISFLQVQNYLPPIDSISKSPDLNVTIVDVGDQQMVLDFYIYEGQTVGRINKEEWAFFDWNQVNSLRKSPEDFTLE